MRFLPAWQEQGGPSEVRYARREGGRRVGQRSQHVYLLLFERIVLPLALLVFSMLGESH